MNDRRCLTPDEYAVERRVSVRTVYRLIKSGKVPAERVGGQWRLWLKIPSGHLTTPPPNASHSE
jgi:excisionase family DNA binding protein